MSLFILLILHRQTVFTSFFLTSYGGRFVTATKGTKARNNSMVSSRGGRGLDKEVGFLLFIVVKPFISTSQYTYTPFFSCLYTSFWMKKCLSRICSSGLIQHQSYGWYEIELVLMHSAHEYL